MLLLAKVSLIIKAILRFGKANKTTQNSKQGIKRQKNITSNFKTGAGGGRLSFLLNLPENKNCARISFACNLRALEGK